MSMELDEARCKIRAVDCAMQELFLRRMGLVAEVAAYKAAHGLPVEDATQEARMTAELGAAVSEPALRAAYERFLGGVVQTSKEWQRHLIARDGSKMRILVINGPNINMLGVREPEVYGTDTFATLCARIEEHARVLGVSVELYQSNHEGALVDKIQAALGVFDGIIINPGAYTHTSIALLDALRAVALPAVEVHLSDVSAREDFRQISYIRAACMATICGRGIAGYLDAMDVLVARLREVGA